MEKSKKTIIYIRTSTDEQNPENQLKDCEGINEFGEYELIEDRQSAWKELAERPGFERVKKLIKSRKVEHLIVWDFDRIYRNRQRFKEFLEFLKVYKVKLHSYRQSWIEELNKAPPPWNEIIQDLLLQIIGWQAEEESNRKSERVKSAMRKKKDGTYSYNGRRWGRKPLSTQAVNKIIQLRNEGKTMREISRNVTYTGKGNHSKNVSLAVVHKIIEQNKEKINRDRD